MNTIIKELGKVCITPKGEWDINEPYDNLDLVYNFENGKSYISKKNVPAGTNIKDTDYWMLFSEAKPNGIIDIPIATHKTYGCVKIDSSLREDSIVPIGMNTEGILRLHISDNFYNDGGRLSLNKDKLDINAAVEKASGAKHGVVRLGTPIGGYLPIGNIENDPDLGLGIKLGTGGKEFNVAPLVLGTEISGSKWNNTVGDRLLGIPINTQYFNVTDKGLSLKEDISGDSATKVIWDANSNMNNFKTPGVYDIYGERTRQDDNLPILNASSGHSIAARLTVVASTLQPANNEICVTQFLMLSNRRGGEGNMYVRTYNENNSPSAYGWTPWQKLQGIREGYIFTDLVQININGETEQIAGVTGLNNMIDNGIYSGVYTDDSYFDGRPTFIETFTLIVINNYAIAGKAGTNRTISQLKYAVDAITNQTSIKQRSMIEDSEGNGYWTDWVDVGSEHSQEVNITDIILGDETTLALMAEDGTLKEGINYIIKVSKAEYLADGRLDRFDAIYNHIRDHIQTVNMPVCLKIKYINHTVIIDYYHNNDVSYSDLNEPFYYRYIMDYNQNYVKVSADMTTLHGVEQ